MGGQAGGARKLSLRAGQRLHARAAGKEGPLHDQLARSEVRRHLRLSVQLRRDQGQHASHPGDRHDLQDREGLVLE